ncbi:TonB-dependent hemoglobin/transferrin/lactoferrin family receptor [Alginatibacterium sediminis]|uniref:TonB-dependent hemoglobin/transferrin/lactoferrin family receptor n=1 Tax=Alginatibacterium sediminis TaxID=2164068 RepID=A0A420ELI9_9ALTE|nr:TonB-dependent hemoglobin/transferrin/lactoferrin family receptor [Alginatibacterium sediminis]RKF21454.1 TonB-dependent hemoglobin/transferrin/lactoferrin family receptor [Alginatibacterium sediminis]
MRINPLTLSILSAFCYSGLLSAEEAEQGVTVFDQVVVSASRTEQNYEDVAATVSRVDSEQMQKQGVNRLEDTVKYIPGVSMNSDGRFGATDFNVRGMEGSRIKVLVDGVEQPVAYDPGGGTMIKGQGGIETDTLSVIEINKGPASSLYGSDALGGAVVMRTKSPEELLQGEDGHASLDAGYQSRDESYKATVNLAKQVNDKAQAMLIYTHRDGSELKTHSSGLDVEGRDRGQADPADYQSDNFLAKLNLSLNPSHNLNFTGEYYRLRNDISVLSNEGYVIVPGMFEYTNNYAKDEVDRARLGLEHQWYADIQAFDELVWKLNWQQSNSKYSTLDTTPFYGDRVRQRDGKDSSLQFDVQAEKEISRENATHLISYGASILDARFELNHSQVSENYGTAIGTDEMPPQTDTLKYGLFIQDQIALLNERLQLSAGLRYDNYSYSPSENPDRPEGYVDFDSDAITGRLGAVYHLLEGNSIYAQYSQGFKAPTPQDLYYVYGQGAIIEPNADLKPESSDSIELGWRHKGSAMQWELAAYYNDYKDFIDRVLTGTSGTKDVYQNQNIGSARIYGLELSSNLSLDRVSSLPVGSYARLSAAWSKGENRSDDVALDSVAPLTAVLGLGFDSRNKRMGWSGTLTAVAGKEGDDWSNEDNLKAPGYALVDLDAYYQATDKLSIRGGIYNLLDTKYWYYSDIRDLDESSQGVDRRTQSGINFGANFKYEL